MYEIELNKRKTKKTDESMRDREGGHREANGQGVERERERNKK